MSKKPKCIRSASDLITSERSTTNGFLLQAIQKIERSEPFIEQAVKFREALKTVNDFDSLIKLTKFREELITSVGFSTKALSHIRPKKVNTLLKKTLEEVYKKHGNKFREALLNTYLLIKGDSLGGSMRNLTGSMGQQVLTQAILSALKSKNIVYKIKTAKANEKIQSLSWDTRCILFDRSPRCVGKNIDVIMLDCSSNKSEEELIENKKVYLACGELKGGIDPAGADEHWKTARSSLMRIKECFEKTNCPALFFVAAAIEKAMANEIYDNLNSGYLAFAANLTDAKQVRDLAAWLISL